VSQANVELYCRTIAGWTRGDQQAWLEGVTGEWEFRSSGLFPALVGLVSMADLREHPRLVLQILGSARRGVHFRPQLDSHPVKRA
jgi:hypothetical protein